MDDLKQFTPSWLNGGLFPRSVPLEQVRPEPQQTLRSVNTRNGPERRQQNKPNGQRRL